MARHNRMRMEWTLASCRTPRSTRKDIEDIFHKPSSGGNRISKPKSKKHSSSNKPPKKSEIKGSWDHTGDDSSQIAEGEGNDSEDGSEDSVDKPYVKGPALTSRGHLKGRKQHSSKKIRNKKTGSAGPTTIGTFARHHHHQDETPTKKRTGAPIFAYESDSDCSSLTMDLEIDDDESALNEYNSLISESEASDVEDNDDLSSDIDELDDEDDDMDDLDEDDQSILDEETDFIIGAPAPVSDDGFLEAIPTECEIPHSPAALSEDSDDEGEDIYMDMDDPVVQKIMNHSYTISGDNGENSDDMFEQYFSDEALDDSDYDSDATIYDGEQETLVYTIDSPSNMSLVPSIPSRSPSPTPVPESVDEKTPTKSLKAFSPPKSGFFKLNPERLICIVENVDGLHRVLTMTADDYFRKADSSSNTTVTTPSGKASEELFAYLPSQSQYSNSIPSEDWDSSSSFNKNIFVGSEWDASSIFDTTQWGDYIVEHHLDAAPEDFVSFDEIALFTEDRRGSESSPIRAFSVPVTAFRANQNNALSRTNSVVGGIHSSGIKKNAPRKDSSLTPSQRRKSDATQPGRQKTPTPLVPFPVPLEPLFADTRISANPAAV
ncbi:hypothetical protein TWF679_010454 [Orbilia oligospora]|uniref:Uncharacterized protein n=1 Tax=Orbilia oligospora TaxID=2813651 RepID=A0A8H8V0J0_ORBOL|nr:hypothetical protein TWF679_010454 [Orbilia oligospora]